MTTETKPRSLQELNLNPSVLIPPRLLELLPNPQNVIAVPFTTWLGRMDQEYQPNLSVILVYRDWQASLIESPSAAETIWERILSHDHKESVQQGLITGSEKPLLTFHALESTIFPLGVWIEMFVIHRDLRGQGVGKSFFQNLEHILKAMNYKIMYGETKDAFGFFLATGWRPTDQLQTIVPPDLEWLTIGDVQSGVRNGFRNVTKFLDPNLEEQCVRHEFLKIPQ